MTEFLELVKGAPNFNAMERSELVIHAYAMFAAGAKADAENVKLRELCIDLYELADESYVPFAAVNKWIDEIADIERRMRKLGIEVE